GDAAATGGRATCARACAAGACGARSVRRAFNAGHQRGALTPPTTTPLVRSTTATTLQRSRPRGASRWRPPYATPPPTRPPPPPPGGRAPPPPAPPSAPPRARAPRSDPRARLRPAGGPASALARLISSWSSLRFPFQKSAHDLLPAAVQPDPHVRERGAR